MSQIQNEQTKLTANLLNNAAAGSITIGVIATGSSVILGTSAASSPGAVLVGMVFWLSAGMGLHWLARLALRKLRDDPD